MKKLFWILTVALLAFTACDNKERPSGDPEGIAMIVKNGDMTGYSRHYLTPGKEDIVVTIEYDDYPNIKTGMPRMEATRFTMSRETTRLPSPTSWRKSSARRPSISSITSAFWLSGTVRRAL